MNQSEIETALEASEFFKKLDQDEIRKISSLCDIQTFETGDFVFRQGDFGEHLYIITEGQVYLERSVDLGTRKGRVVIEALGKGRVFGCWSTLLDNPHVLMSSASCQNPTKVVRLKGTDLREMMTGNKAIGFHILERLSFLLRDRIQAAYGAFEKI